MSEDYKLFIEKTVKCPLQPLSVEMSDLLARIDYLHWRNDTVSMRAIFPDTMNGRGHAKKYMKEAIDEGLIAQRGGQWYVTNIGRIRKQIINLGYSRDLCPLFIKAKQKRSISFGSYNIANYHKLMGAMSNALHKLSENYNSAGFSVISSRVAGVIYNQRQITEWPNPPRFKTYHLTTLGMAQKHLIYVSPLFSPNKGLTHCTSNGKTCTLTLEWPNE